MKKEWTMACNLLMASSTSGAPTKTPKCRVALVGANVQRVSRVISLLHQSNSAQDDGSLSSDNTKFISPTHQHELSEVDLPINIPSLVEIEYLPCVATFDSYEDESGGMVRYLVKLEYHGEHGTLIKGESLASFFDGDGSNDNHANGEENPFYGISAVAIGCGLNSAEDMEKVSSFMDTLSGSCRQIIRNTDGSAHDDSNQILVECVQCNAEYKSMKAENEAFRVFNEVEKKEAINNQTIGPGKMAKFVYEVAQKVVCQKWSKELDAIELQKKSENIKEAQHKTIDDKAATEATKQLQEQLSTTGTEDERAVPTPPNNVHIPDPSNTRYACKRCRTVLFGEADLEDPPHAPSLHNFRKKSTFKSQSQACANHCLATTLPWMSAMDDMEGKLHCFKCQTKIGHYSWTGAQCSCGTWITPAIMIPMSKVDEMGGSLFADSNNVNGVIRMPIVYAADSPTATIT